MFANSVSSTDGFKVQVTNFDSSFQWALGSAVRSELTLTGTITSSIDASGLITVGGLKPGVSMGLTVTTTKSGFPTKMSVVGGQSFP
jgi:hypothetical protein